MERFFNAEFVLNYMKENNISKTKLCKLCHIGKKKAESVFTRRFVAPCRHFVEVGKRNERGFERTVVQTKTINR